MQKKFSIILIVIVFSAALVYANSRGILSGAFNFTNSVTSPVSLFFSQLSQRTSGTFSGIFNLGKVQKENAELKDNINKLRAEVAQLSEAKKENESLKRDLGFIQKTNFTYEPAEVIAFDPSNLRSAITVNKGTENGLAAGMAVISDGFMVGRISEITPKTAKVQLITDPNSAIPVTIQDTNTNGITKGEIGYGLSMEKIPQGDQAKEGATVITSGLGGEIPRGLILGTIEKILRQENSLFVSASIRPSANLSTLYRVLVIKSK